MSRPVRLAGVAVAAALASGPAPGQTLAARATVSEAAVATLLEQANYWRLQNRPDQVARALDRVLAVDPQNAEALAGAAQAQAQLGNRAAADALIARLRAAAPADPRLQETDLALRASTVDPAALAEARRLAQAGRAADAVARYREVFRGSTPPDPFAQEYYATLAGTDGGFEEARKGLARLAERAPADARLQLAYAQVLTYRDGTRAEGIARLRRLAAGADKGGAVTAAWRQALLWQGAGPALIPDLEAFLERNPNDPAITGKLAEARTPPAPGAAGPPDEAAAARLRGFDLLNANRAREAGRDFEAAIARNPEDADAVGGLGIVRLREGRFGEARSLLERAIRLDPAKRANWQKALDGASYSAELAAARGQIQQGDLDAAEQSLRRALSRGPSDSADAEALLGDIARRRGDLEGAEARYRAALSRRPNLGAATSGLYEVLQQQGRFAEAEALQGRAARAANEAGANAARANQLRTEAQRANDPEDQLIRLREAMTLDPASPWIRLDLARALARQGQQAEARQLMEAAAGTNAAEALHAAALFADEDGRPGDAAAALNRIPARLRSADMNRLLARGRVAAEVDHATTLWQSGRQAEGRAALVAIAARPDPTGGAGALAVRALGSLGDREGAVQAGRAAVSANAAAPPAARLAVAGALLGAGAEQEAGQIARSVELLPNLSAEDRRQATSLQAGFAIRASDRLNEQGNQAAGYEALAPVLSRDPTNPAANLALARLYQGARQPEQAAQIADTVLRSNPGNMEARVAAVDAAIAQRDWDRAEALLLEARAFNPGDARVPLMEARIARARGYNARALRALERAQEQAAARGGVTPVAAAGAVPTGNPFRQVGTAVAAGPGTLPAGDPVVAEIQRELAAVREEASAYIQGGVAGRFRSGTAGLDRLSDFSAPMTASLPVGGIGGRLTATMAPVTIDSGRLDNGNLSTLRSFGTNALVPDLRQPAGQQTGPSQAIRERYTPRDDSAAGLGLGLAYTRSAFSADVGTTPLGFRQQNVIGGIEIAPALTNTLRLRLTGERRPVTDSLLSWAGARDPSSGQVWGGVVRTGGRAQLEIGTQPVSFYVAGGYSTFQGDRVQNNSRLEAGAGASWTVYREPNEQLTAGLDLVYFAYDKNQRLFTVGNGGYFSPQSYLGVNLPVDYRARSGNLAYHLGGTIGYQSYREDAAKYFPLDPGLQAQAELAAAGDGTLRAGLPASQRSGITGGLRGDIEYSITPQLRIGGLLRYDRTANWNEARGMLYARYRFDR
ncbi:cellulose biosynthesis protein BcsC [Paracraurococcus lichenis]|uniref:Cellulose synthase subunit BcsC-related outer membrane protein n=1 Tax=Paracraurococcus lichenis TaxID=3064888 RepID=A0ABT9DVZ6_9PROT|nr:cellulose biosynthesis protein BcsC [Paracraurococcus sp. LOR1-02]MDO9708074.1 cellulose synthase subunit BcsC-related outer membrane protein [Paracraurococcus sp. LOR1-02]